MRLSVLITIYLPHPHHTTPAPTQHTAIQHPAYTLAILQLQQRPSRCPAQPQIKMLIKGLLPGVSLNENTGWWATLRFGGQMLR